MQSDIRRARKYCTPPPSVDNTDDTINHPDMACMMGQSPDIY